MPARGFTLIEVLVAIAILAVIAAVAIPNFRRFSEEQTLKNVTANLIAALRTAQNNTQTGVKCPDGVSTPQSWSVLLSTNSYYLQESCLNLTTSTSSTNSLPAVTYPPNVSMSSPTGSCSVTFTTTGVSSSSSCLSVTLNDGATSPPKRQIVIDKGGAITCQAQNADGSIAANPC